MSSAYADYSREELIREIEILKKNALLLTMVIYIRAGC